MNTRANLATVPDRQRTVDLEDALHNLRNMAEIASELVTDDLGSSHAHVTGHRDKYHLTERQRDRLVFSVCHLRDMVDDLLHAYNRSEVAI